MSKSSFECLSFKIIKGRQILSTIKEILNSTMMEHGNPTKGKLNSFVKLFALIFEQNADLNIRVSVASTRCVIIIIIYYYYYYHYYFF